MRITERKLRRIIRKVISEGIPIGSKISDVQQKAESMMDDVRIVNDHLVSNGSHDNLFDFFDEIRSVSSRREVISGLNNIKSMLRSNEIISKFQTSVSPIALVLFSLIHEIGASRAKTQLSYIDDDAVKSALYVAKRIREKFDSGSSIEDLFE